MKKERKKKQGFDCQNCGILGQESDFFQFNEILRLNAQKNQKKISSIALSLNDFVPWDRSESCTFSNNSF